MKCFQCNHPLEEGKRKIGFRECCSHCGASLHTCTNCQYYALGKPNDCIVPGTETIREKEAANFCEEFKLKTNSLPHSSENKKQNFHSLFKDEDLS